MPKKAVFENPNKATSNLALCLDEVRILIFDDPAELCERQRPGSGSWEGKLSNARGRAARAMHDFFFENLRNPAHNRRAGLMRQFSSGQLYSNTAVSRI